MSFEIQKFEVQGRAGQAVAQLSEDAVAWLVAHFGIVVGFHCSL